MVALVSINSFSMFQLSSDPIKISSVPDAFYSENAGALCSFEGRIRHQNAGKVVRGMEYEGYEPLCRSEAGKIMDEAKQKFGILGVWCFHRIGWVGVGEPAVWVGVTAAHREEAFLACKFIVDEIKSRLPIWKKEYYHDGHSAWIGVTTFDPE